ncbi:MAG: hypothetical protein WAU88_07210 [Candidatus Zixiibacteriota bacterium]
MIEIPTPPEIVGVQWPKSPVSWRPSDRFAVHDTWFLATAEQFSNGEVFKEAKLYADWLTNHYIIPPEVQRPTVLRLVKTSVEFLSEEHCDDKSSTVRKLEDAIGLTGNSPYWESNAGGASGTYPADQVAHLLGTSGESLYSQLQCIPDDYWVIRAGQLIVPILVKGRINDEKLTVSNPYELSDLGIKSLEMLLRTYEDLTEPANA